VKIPDVRHQFHAHTVVLRFSSANNSADGLLTPPKAFIPTHFGASAAARYPIIPLSITESDHGSNPLPSRERPAVRSTSQQIPLPEADEDNDEALQAAVSKHKVMRIEHAEQVCRPYMRSLLILRSADSRNIIQRKEIENLRAKLETVNYAKTELSKKLEFHKVAATKALEARGKR
jgi:hypothetical protein